MKNNRGFTLIELSISLTIVFLMIAGSLSIMKLMKANQVNLIMMNIEKIRDSVKIFGKNYYGFNVLPGDVSNINYGGHTYNGNDNNRLEDKEKKLFWESLYYSRAIELNLSNLSDNGNLKFDNTENIAYTPYKNQAHQTLSIKVSDFQEHNNMVNKIESRFDNNDLASGDIVCVNVEGQSKCNLHFFMW